MIEVIIDNKAWSIPDKWPDVTVDQLVKLTLGYENPHDLILIFTGPEILNSKDISKVDEIEYYLQFLSQPFDFIEASKNRSDVFVFNKVGFSLPTDLGDSSIGQYKDMAFVYSEYLKEDDEQINHIRRFKCYVDAISIYLQPIIDQYDYDYKRAELIANDIYKCSALEVAAWGSFFIRKYAELKNGIQNNALKLTTHKKNQWQGFHSFIARLGGMLRFIR